MIIFVIIIIISIILIKNQVFEELFFKGLFKAARRGGDVDVRSIVQMPNTKLISYKFPSLNWLCKLSTDLFVLTTEFRIYKNSGKWRGGSISEKWCGQNFS